MSAALAEQLQRKGCTRLIRNYFVLPRNSVNRLEDIPKQMTARTALGHKLPRGLARGASALPPKAAAASAERRVR
jgi:hypothetical protein